MDWMSVTVIVQLSCMFLDCLNPVLTALTYRITYGNSTFCPHSVFMCFVSISEQTAIISLYNIN